MLAISLWPRPWSYSQYGGKILQSVPREQSVVVNIIAEAAHPLVTVRRVQDVVDGGVYALDLVDLARVVIQLQAEQLPTDQQARTRWSTASSRILLKVSAVRSS
jgi:hypothetical protein